MTQWQESEREIYIYCIYMYYWRELINMYNWGDSILIYTIILIYISQYMYMYNSILFYTIDTKLLSYMYISQYMYMYDSILLCI